MGTFVAILLFVAALYSGVLLSNSTIIPVTQTGWVPNQPYEYAGPFPTQIFTRDPAGTSASDVAALGYLSSSWSKGYIPFWNPFQGLGQPFSADAPAAAFYPFNSIYLFVDPKYSDLVQLFQIALGGAFVYLFASLSIKQSKYSLIASCAYITSGFYVIFIPTSSVISTAIWIPLTLFAAESIFRTPNCRWAPLLLTAAIVGMGTGGHISFFIFGAITLCIYIVLRLLIQRAWCFRGLTKIAISVFAGAMISAPQWLLTVDYVFEAKELISGVQSGAFTLQTLPALFFPYVYGWLNDTNVFTFQGSVLGDYWGLGWIIPPISFLFLFGLFHINSKTDPSVIATLGVLLVFICWAFGVPPFSYISDIPLLGRLKVGYMMAVPMIGVAIVAGYGFSQIEQCKEFLLVSIVGIWFILIAVLLAVVFSVSPVSISELFGNARAMDTMKFGLFPGLAWSVIFPLSLVINRLTRMGASSFNTTLLAIFLSAISYFPFYEPPMAGLLRLGACALFVIWVAAELCLSYLVSFKRYATITLPIRAIVLVISCGVGTLFISLPNRSDPFRAPDEFKALDAYSSSPYRIYGVGGFLHPNLTSSSGLRSLNFLQALMPPRSVPFLKSRIDEAQFWPAFIGRPDWQEYYGARFQPWVQFQIHRRFWDYLGVKYLVGRDLQLDSIEVPAAKFVARDFPASFKGEWADIPSYSSEAIISCKHGHFSVVRVPLRLIGSGTQPNIRIDVYDKARLIARSSFGGRLDALNEEGTFIFDKPLCVYSSNNVHLKLSTENRGNHKQHVQTLLSGTEFLVRPLSIARAQNVFPPLLSASDGRIDPSILNKIQQEEQEVPVVPLSRTSFIPLKCSMKDIAGIRLWLPTTRYTGKASIQLRIIDSSGQARVEAVDSFHFTSEYFRLLRLPPGTCQHAGELLLAEITLLTPDKMTAFVRQDRFLNLVHNVLEESSSPLERINTIEKTEGEVWLNPRADPVAYVAPTFSAVLTANDALNNFVKSKNLREIAYVDGATENCPTSVGSYNNHEKLKIKSISIQPNSVMLIIETLIPGTFVLTDSFFPGWKATVDEKSREVFRVNGTFRGVCIFSPGTHKIVFFYRPRLLNTSIFLVFCGIITLGALLFSFRLGD
jgi:hypothetical protein